MSHLRSLIAALALLALAACGKKEEQALMPGEPSTSGGLPGQVVCSYAPSQSEVVANVASAGGGGAVAAAAIAKAVGLTAVTHSSGAYILTGAGGYIAGTLGTAIAGPIVIGVGVVVGGTAATVELLCAPMNHPELVAKVEAAAGEYFTRTKTVVTTVASSAKPIAADLKKSVIQRGQEAFDYAQRKSVQFSEAVRR